MAILGLVLIIKKIAFSVPQPYLFSGICSSSPSLWYCSISTPTAGAGDKRELHKGSANAVSKQQHSDSVTQPRYQQDYLGSTSQALCVQVHLRISCLFCCLWSAYQDDLQNSTFRGRNKALSYHISAHSYQRNVCWKFHKKLKLIKLLIAAFMQFQARYAS